MCSTMSAGVLGKFRSMFDMIPVWLQSFTFYEDVKYAYALQNLIISRIH